ncbi:MAG: MmcQ/YjbR family DNA-binding protein [Prevotellaceae bacterium]|jgi:predicted DNA-binding protein (MmcQ/YjbR family)|nr:MmcQ/YjbR family DNA-binding protein [Prevotellaceae bacterium]
MNIEEARDYCLSQKGATEDFPFDDVSLVIKVGGKMFALIPLDAEEKRIALKCDPEFAIELREKYAAVRPAFHFNKKHWNDVFFDGSVSGKNIKKWIDHSYEMVLKGISKKMREQILFKT